MTPGKRIKSRRRFRGLTQRELGAVIGVGPKAIVQYEADRTDPRFRDMVKLCKFLKLDIMDMVKDIEKGTEG